MKDYHPGTWGLKFIFSLDGSVFPRATCIALPNACIAVLSWYFWNHNFASRFVAGVSGVSTGQVWSAFNFIIGFIVSFRASRAYSRWWEGGTLLQQARGEWFNAYSSLIAFCSCEPDQECAVVEFQHVLSRLMSLLHASALMSVSTEEGIDFEIIDSSGIDDGHLQYLRAQSDKCEIIMQWIQRLIVNNMENRVLPIPPPVISRVFQELSRGIVNVHNVRKITEFQFPFPLAQMIMTMLLVQWFVTPFMCSLLVASPIWAAILSFFPIFACWGINFIAAEIEQPFGTDANDMPMHFMQAAMNNSICALLEPEAQQPPFFDLSKAQEQCGFPEPSKTGGREFDENPLPEMRSALFLTFESKEQLHKQSRRFVEASPERRHGRRFAKNTAKLEQMGSKRGRWSQQSGLTRNSCSSAISRQQLRGFSRGLSACKLASSSTLKSGSRVSCTTFLPKEDPCSLNEGGEVPEVTRSLGEDEQERVVTSVGVGSTAGKGHAENNQELKGERMCNNAEEHRSSGERRRGGVLGKADDDDDDEVIICSQCGAALYAAAVNCVKCGAPRQAKTTSEEAVVP